MLQGLPFLPYFLFYIVSKHTHNIDDHLETNNHKDHLNCLKLQSDNRDDPYDRDNYVEASPYGVTKM